MARPLRDLLAGLAGEAADPAEALREGGHPDLPEALVAEAIVSYADTAPAEVAEHLAPFVIDHGPVPSDPAAAGLAVTEGLQLVATAPAVPTDDAEPFPEPFPEPPAEAAGTGEVVGDFGAGHSGGWADDPFDLAFGEGGPAGEGAAGPEGADYGEDPPDRAQVAGEDPGAVLPEADPADLFPLAPPAEPDPGEPDEPDPGFASG
jgi:hypothetical protein